MANITFFTEASENDSEDLPWAKEWMKGVLNPSEPKEVFTIYAGDKGLLVLTGDYKHFIFKKQSVAKYLLEALEVWVQEQKAVDPLVGCCINKQVQLGLDHEGKKIYWHKDDSKFYSVRADDTPSTKQSPGKNPFLSPITPPSEPAAPPKRGAKG